MGSGKRPSYIPNKAWATEVNGKPSPLTSARFGLGPISFISEFGLPHTLRWNGRGWVSSEAMCWYSKMGLSSRFLKTSGWLWKWNPADLKEFTRQGVGEKNKQQWLSIKVRFLKKYFPLPLYRGTQHRKLDHRAIWTKDKRQIQSECVFEWLAARQEDLLPKQERHKGKKNLQQLQSCFPKIQYGRVYKMRCLTFCLCLLYDHSLNSFVNHS